MLGRGGEHLAVGRDGGIEIVEPLLVDLAQAVLELEDLVRRLADLGFARQDLREITPALGPQEEPVERADRGLVFRVGGEDAAVARDGAVDVVELNLVDLGYAKAQIDQPVGLSCELVELGVVELGHLRPAIGHAAESLERTQGLFVAVVGGEGARVDVESGVRVAQAVFVEAGHAVQDVDLRHRVFREAGLHLENADELRPLAAGVVHRFEHRGGPERIEGAGLEALESRESRVVRGLASEDLAIQLDGARNVVEVLLVELGDAVLVRNRFVRIVAELGFVREHAEKLLPVLRGLVEDVEPAERREVVGVELENARVGVDRLVDLAELVLEHGADLVEDALLLVDVGDEIGFLRVDVEEILPPRQAEVELDESVHRANVFRVALEDLQVDADRRVVPLEKVFFDLRGLVERALSFFGVIQNFGLALQDHRQIGVALGATEQLFESLGGRDVGRIGRQDLLEVGDGAFDVAQIVLVAPRAHRVERARHVRFRLRRRELFEDAREVGEAPGGASQTIETLLGELVRRILGQRARVRIERGVQIAGRILVERRDLVKELDLAHRVGRPPDLDLVYADELLEVARLPVERFEDLGDGDLVRLRLPEPLESAEGARVGRIAIEHLTVPFDGFRHLPHLALTKPRQAKHELELRFVGRREPQLRLEVVGEVDPHLLSRVERVECRQRDLARVV